jgi:Holliday junction DNA helicase RuvA
VSAFDSKLMIAYLNGTVQKNLTDSLIVTSNGVGYLVFSNNQVLSEYEEQDTIELYIHTAVKEDDIKLFGFKTLEELKLFKLLISVSGVGPKTALEILNNPINSIKYAISNGDSALIVNTKGIGKKTAERIIVDLKEKIVPIDKPEEYTTPNEIDKDAVKALTNLGYRHHQIIQTLKNIPEDIKDTESVIRYFLQNA